jgi:hypothetical protein
VLLETQQNKVALSAMVIKTECKDAPGTARSLRMGWYRPARPKPLRAREISVLLTGRKLLQDSSWTWSSAFQELLCGSGTRFSSISDISGSGIGPK